MKTLTLRSDKHSSSVTLALDDANGRAILLARTDDSQTQVAYLELKFADLSVSLFNSSDLGLTVDNLGVTTVHQLNIEGAFTAATELNGGKMGVDGVGPWISSASGKRFRLVVDEDGSLQLPLPPVE